MDPARPAAALLRDPRLAAFAFSAAPAWLWAADGSRLLWANAEGAAVFRATPSGILGRAIDGDDPAGREVRRLRATLPASGAAQLARLRGFGTGVAAMLTCSCRRIAQSDGSIATLIAATAPASRPMRLAERAARMIEPAAGSIFSTDGALLHADPSAAWLAGRTTLAAFGADHLGVTALADGIAQGETAVGAMTLERLGAGDAVVLLATRTANAAAEPMAKTVAPPSDQPAAESKTPRNAPPAAAALDDAELRLVARRHPLRFVWRMDADSLFAIEPGDFTVLTGDPTVAMLGKPWAEVADALALDPAGQVLRAVASHDTWSGVVIEWPVEGEGLRLPVVLSGLPVLTRERAFNGYRGFGVCRDVTRIAAVIAARREAVSAEPLATPDDQPSEPAAARDNASVSATELRVEASPDGRPRLTIVPASKNVVPLRAGVAIEKRPALSPIERSAFQEIARALGARLEGEGTPPEHRAETPPGESAESPVDVAQAAEELAEALQLLVTADGADETARQAEASAAADAAAQTAAAAEAAQAQLRELRSILDTATDGVIVLGADGSLLSSNLSAQALFGYEGHELAGRSFLDLLAPESQRVAVEYLDGLARSGVASLLNDGREVIGRVRQGGLVQLFVTMGRIGEGPAKFCAVFRDLTALKRAEEELVAAKRQAERASSAKADILAKVSHELRSPLTAILGFAQLMSDERFGPVGDERYRAYLKDIHACGTQVIALLDDLLDLAKVESGRLELNFARVDLNAVMQQSVAAMQPHANRERIIIRTALSPDLPAVVADARSVRQIVTNLLSNSIKFTGAGGQVIVSTALTDAGEAVLRVRDTGIGMSEKQIETALQPFHRVQINAPALPAGAGLGLPLSKALAEANRAVFQIKSAVNAGTLAEVIFPATPVLTQ